MLIGHQKQWNLLRKIVRREKISHALLFSGPQNIGKMTLAMELAKLIFCEKQNFEEKPCNNCRSCRDVQRLSHPDLTLLQPQEKVIKISQIRNLQRNLSLKPYTAPVKIGLIDDAHLMQKSAQNCLLKTLEEPKGRTLLILITPYPQMLFKTLLSQFQILKFSLPSQKEIEKYLSSQDISTALAKEMSLFSFGKPGKVVEFLKNPQKLTQQKETIRQLLNLCRSDIGQRFDYVKKMVNSSGPSSEILETWERYFRKILLSKIKGPQKNILTNLPSEKLKDILKTLETTNFLIKTTNINQRLALENLMLKL